MIANSTEKIMIVPDFGVSVEDKAMVALKDAIEADDRYTAKIIDLPAIVREEHKGEDLKDSKLIELCSKKLESLAADHEQIWDLKTPYYDFDLFMEEEGVDDNLLDQLKTSLEEEAITYELGRPTAIVIFGKSAMLAAGVKCDLLFIDPEYDSEWPWKKQFYADEKLTPQYFTEKHAYEKGQMETVLSCGTETSGRRRYKQRYGIFTDDNYASTFARRYPNLYEEIPEFKTDTEALAKFIREFADRKMTYPLEEVYDAIKKLPGRSLKNIYRICDFEEPLKLDYFTVLGLRFGPPQANGQSCNKLKVAERDYVLPLEGIKTRRELNALRDAILKKAESRPPEKRILIVPDYFTPYNSPQIKWLHSILKGMGYYAAVYVAGNDLEKSRIGIERRCKAKPFDLIVTLETGCMLASRITNCTRIFVNPDWTAWKSMKRLLGEKEKVYKSRIDNGGPLFSYSINQEEIWMARSMAERSNILRGQYPIYGWFSEDAIESNETMEHMKRFNTCTYIPGLRIDTDEGISILADQINNILSIE